MSARNRDRRHTLRADRARHLLPPALAVREMIDAPTPVPATPHELVFEEPEARDERLRTQAAAGLPMSIAMRQPFRYGPAVPLNQLEAWMELHAPKLWVRMQRAIAEKPLQRGIRARGDEG